MHLPLWAVAYPDNLMLDSYYSVLHIHPCGVCCIVSGWGGALFEESFCLSPNWIHIFPFPVLLMHAHAAPGLSTTAPTCLTSWTPQWGPHPLLYSSRWRMSSMAAPGKPYERYIPFPYLKLDLVVDQWMCTLVSVELWRLLTLEAGYNRLAYMHAWDSLWDLKPL